MDSERFDTLARTVSTRRTVMGALLGGSVAVLLGIGEAEEASAHNPVAKCKTIKSPSRRRACLRKARTHNRGCHPESRGATCAGRCGTVTNNCGQDVSCSCSTGKACLGNGTCGRICSAPDFLCPGCTGCSVPNVEGEQYCIQDGPSSPDQACASSAECPPGYHCQSAGGSTMCIPLCQQ